jgi:nitrite reductase/ring-hydroxylating ferredoxin subunit
MSVDLAGGVSIQSLPDSATIAGTVGDDEVVLVWTGDTFFAVVAHCTHYRGKLADGLVVGSTIRCPLHHACFDLATGEAVRAPALDPIACWQVRREGDRVCVGEKMAPRAPAVVTDRSRHPSSIIIMGGGAAGLAAADMLRRDGYGGPITMISADADPPVDRPNLSKDYLAGEAQDDWIPLWPAEWYVDRRVDLVLDSRVIVTCFLTPLAGRLAFAAHAGQ